MTLFKKTFPNSGIRPNDTEPDRTEACPDAAGALKANENFGSFPFFS